MNWRPSEPDPLFDAFLDAVLRLTHDPTVITEAVQAFVNLARSEPQS